MGCLSPVERPAAAPAAKWTATTELMPHQLEAVAKLLPGRVGALFAEMGTGKTRTMIELARLRQAKIDRVVVFCPVAVRPTIRREILKHTDCRDDDIDMFDDATDERNVPVAKPWHIVGIESMSSSVRVVSAAQRLIDDRTMVVVDESTYIKGHFAKRTRRITLVSEAARYRLLMTGTPVTQGAVDLYAQMRFLSPKILGYTSFHSFAANHLVYSDRYKGLIRRTLNTGWLAERMKPYVYQVRKKDCLSLPDKARTARWCALTREQLDAYERAKLDFADDVLRWDDGDGLQSGIAIFRLFSRLQSIVCGFDCGAPGSPALPHNRLAALMSAIRELDDRHLVVWTKFQRSVDEIMAALGADGRTAFGFDGRVPETDRERLVDEWVARGGVLVATQSLGSHGLNQLTAASTALFYANGFKYSERIQTEDRHHRIGVTGERVLYVDIWAECGIEDRIAKAQSTKSNALRQFRLEIDAVKGRGKQGVRDLVMRL
jgi:SNF2 family DNA or RNA helicase